MNVTEVNIICLDTTSRRVSDLLPVLGQGCDIGIVEHRLVEDGKVP